MPVLPLVGSTIVPPGFSRPSASAASTRRTEQGTQQGYEEGYAPVGDLRLYWRSLGAGGTPLVVVHGGFGVVDMFGDVLGALAAQRRVVALELQGHGHTADVDRPFTWERF